MLKYCWLIGFTGLVATGCGTGKKATVRPAPAATTKTTGGSPRFMENISIKSGNASASGSANTTHRLTGPVNTASSVEISDPLQFKYSILLNVPVEDLTDGRLIAFIEDWYGTRYRYGGNDKNGVDCSAFAQTFLSNLYGLMLPRTSSQQYQQSKRIQRDDLKEGDLVFFKTMGRKSGISHVGVYLCNNKFVHASTSGGVMINDIDDAYYSSHYAGAGRVR